ncbi:helix-turn-helix domain-containing protein [Daejeonella lutea]|uniref:Helix-turn-helix n=1 Tax=Daejeonella lutea TaxID=572036 RepID=A0A1T5AZK3_9SPHI|nr:helix-turn-helix transcriptional regulator [Daejeonella lutea]SKB40190.1 Helix-turn-helix [Daejeonella lutea]
MEIFNFGANLRRKRILAGISQEAVAFKMNISQSKYSRIERGRFLPDDQFIAQLAEFLGIPESTLKPKGWDHSKKIKLVSSLTYPGVIAYRILLIVAAWDVTRGFWDGAQISSIVTKLVLACLIGFAALVFWYYTEYTIDEE